MSVNLVFDGVKRPIPICARGEFHDRVAAATGVRVEEQKLIGWEEPLREGQIVTLIRSAPAAEVTEPQAAIGARTLTSDEEQRQRGQAEFLTVLGLHSAVVWSYEQEANLDNARPIVCNDTVMTGADGDQESMDALVRRLFNWFRETYFRRREARTCPLCRGTYRAMPPGGQFTQHVSPINILNICGQCGMSEVERAAFEPAEIFAARQGGRREYASALTFACRALGVEARFIYSWPDRAWTEYYSEARHAWVPLDPWEGRVDDALSHDDEAHQVTYAIAFSADGVYDVSRRYARRPDALIHRRTAVGEEWLASMLTTLSNGVRARASEDRRRAADARRKLELESLP